MKKKSGWLHRLIYLGFFLIFIIGCQKQQANLKKDDGPQVIPVKVITIAPQDMQELLDYVANIKAQQEVLVFPKVTGKIIEKVKEEGDSVAKAEVIAFIDRDEVGLTFAKAPVESPISGVVGKVMVDIGSNVSAQTPVALVVDMEKVKVSLDVPEKYLTKITLGMHATVTVDAYSEQSFDGILEKINPVLDIPTRTIQVEILIDNKDHKLRSGMYAKVKLVTQEYKNTLAVLKEAVLGREPKQYVYVVDGQKAQLKEITTGVRQGAYLQVKEGVKAGDKVVIMGQQRLYEGALVLVEENGK
jgi:membrane fusion protein (multidrug efflux system)